MVKITVYQNHDQQFVGFDCLGHAEYSDENDIVCAAVSAMTINCINSIETFTETLFYCDTNETDGMISFRITEKNGTDAQLLQTVRLLFLLLISWTRNHGRSL